MASLTKEQCLFSLSPLSSAFCLQTNNITSVWLLRISTSFLALISKVNDQFRPNFVYVSNIQGGNIYM